MTPEEKAKELIASGYQSISNQHKMLARLPEGKTGVQLLAEKAPSWLRRWEEMATSHYMRVHAIQDGNSITVDPETFAAFKRLGGRVA